MVFLLDLMFSEREVGMYNDHEGKWIKVLFENMKRKMEWKFYWLKKWKCNEGFIYWKWRNVMMRLASESSQVLDLIWHHMLKIWCFIFDVALIVFLWNKCGLWERHCSVMVIYSSSWNLQKNSTSSEMECKIIKRERWSISLLMIFT